MRLFLLILALLPPLVWGQHIDKRFAGFDPKTDLISEKYDAGPFLMYDCEDGHWVCVMPEFYQSCQEQREQDREQKKVTARCAPVGEFPTKRSCFERQLYMLSHNYGPNFCVLDEWKQKTL